MSKAILDQQDVCKHGIGCVQNRVARSFVIFTSFNSSTNEVLSCSIIGLANSNRDLNREQIRVCSDRSDMRFRNLVRRSSGSAITKKCSTSDFFVQHDSHLAFDPGNHIEISDVNNVIAIHFLFLVYSLRVSRSLDQAEELLFLEVAFNVTQSTSIIFCDVSHQSFDPGKRSMLNGCHKVINPVSISLNPLRSRIQALVFRKQHIRIIHAILIYIFSCRCCASRHTVVIRSCYGMSKYTVFCVLANSFFQRSNSLSIIKDRLHVSMAQVFPVVFYFECVMFHFFVLLVFIVIIFCDGCDQCIYSGLLFFGKSIKDIFYSLSLFLLFFFYFFLRLFLLFCHVFLLLFFSMDKSFFSSLLIHDRFLCFGFRFRRKFFKFNVTVLKLCILFAYKVYIYFVISFVSM